MSPVLSRGIGQSRRHAVQVSSLAITCTLYEIHKTLQLLTHCEPHLESLDQNASCHTYFLNALIKPYRCGLHRQRYNSFC